VTFGASGRILLLSNEIRLRSNKAMFKSVRGMHPWLKIRGKYKRGRLKSVSKPGRETAPGFSLDGRQRWGARQIFLGMPNTTVRGANYDFCATCDFWTLKRNSCIEGYPSGVCPARPGKPAAGLAQPRDEHGAEPARGRGGKHRQACRPAGRAGQRSRHPHFLRCVEAPSTPVVAPVMCLFGGAAGFAFSQSVQKGGRRLPVNFTFYREPVPPLLFAGRHLFLPCSLQGYRAATHQRRQNAPVCRTQCSMDAACCSLLASFLLLV
jgi:hypothetical protein